MNTTKTRGTATTPKTPGDTIAGIQKSVAATRSARKPRPTAKSGNPQTDKAVREAAAEAAAKPTPAPKPGAAHAAEVENSVLNGVGADKPAAPRKARASTARVHRSVATIPARKSKCQWTLVNGQFRVHKMGCKDVAVDLKNSLNGHDAAMSAEWATEYEAICDLYSDHIAEAWDPALGQVSPSPEWLSEHAFVGAVDFMPCCNLASLTFTPGVISASPKAVAGKSRTVPAEDKAKTASRKREVKRNLARAVLLAVENLVNDRGAYGLDLADMTKAEAAECVSQWLHHLPVRDSAEAKGERPWWPKSLPLPDRSDWR